MVMQSKKLRAEEEAKPTNAILDIPVVKKDKVIKIAPIRTFNDWVILMPFNIDTNLELQADSQYRDVGIVVGKSETMMTPHGEFVPSRLRWGQVIWFQKKSVVGELGITKEPYAGRRLILLSEKNVICELPAVPFEVLDIRIGEEDINIIQKD